MDVVHSFLFGYLLQKLLQFQERNAHFSVSISAAQVAAVPKSVTHTFLFLYLLHSCCSPQERNTHFSVQVFAAQAAAVPVSDRWGRPSEHPWLPLSCWRQVWQESCWPRHHARAHSGLCRQKVWSQETGGSRWSRQQRRVKEKDAESGSQRFAWWEACLPPLPPVCAAQSVCVSVSVSLCVSVCVGACVSRCVHACVCVCVCVCMCACMHRCVHACVCVCVCMCVCVPKHIHTHTHRSTFMHQSVPTYPLRYALHLQLVNY